MFSFFDYLRRRTCDSVLAGLYDACDLIEAQNANESGQMAENLPGSFAGPAELKPVDPPPAHGERPPTTPRPTQGPPGGRPNSPPSGGPPIPRFPQQPAPPGGDSEARKRGRPPKSPEAPQ